VVKSLDSATMAASGAFFKRAAESWGVQGGCKLGVQQVDFETIVANGIFLKRCGKIPCRQIADQIGRSPSFRNDKSFSGRFFSFSQPGKPPHLRLQRRYSTRVRPSGSPTRTASADALGS
jgi:hypothetical protein